ncbi:unnamed protein product [Mytilus coruscus]|uniref:SH3 domain-containing protein n=1 Tax=Mytilus coruscus TaxID=42192 RepID=A0A6J8DJZ0_MYTCO|nr:unnamed protein product [Mytilus coruscus]
MTSYELFNPDSIEFKKRHLTDLTFWKHYAEEKAAYYDLLSKKIIKTTNEYRKKLVKIDGYKVSEDRWLQRFVHIIASEDRWLQRFVHIIASEDRWLQRFVHIIASEDRWLQRFLVEIYGYKGLYILQLVKIDGYKGLYILQLVKIDGYKGLYILQLVKIDGYKDFPLLKSFEAAMTRDEIQAEELRSVASSFSCLSRDLQSEIDSISTSEYEKEAAAFRKLVKIHSKALRETESDRDKINHVAFKLERMVTNPCKNEKYNSIKQLLDSTIARYNTNKEGELLLRAKFISKSEELKKLWKEEEKERLDVLLKGWKHCLTAENQLKHKHQGHGDRALKIADNIYNGDVCTDLANMRVSSCKYRDFEDSSTLVNKAAKHLDTGEKLNTTEETAKLHGKSRCKSTVGTNEKKNNTEDKHCKSLTLLQTPRANTSRENNRAATLPARERHKTNRRRDRQLAHSHDKDDSQYEITRCRQPKKSHAHATYHPDELQYTEIQDLSKEDNNTSDDENLSDLGDKGLKNGKAKKGKESGDGIKTTKHSKKKVYARVIPQMRQTEDTGHVVSHHDDSNEVSIDSSDDNSTFTDSGSVASTDHFSFVEREGVTAEATATTIKGHLVPPPDSATFSYLSAFEILDLREVSTRRLNVYLHLIATEMYKSNDHGTFSLKKGESVIIMQTPTTDGLAFGYKKIRLNTKKKYGLFPVYLTKIDYSVDQNLENILRIKQ